MNGDSLRKLSKDKIVRLLKQSAERDPDLAERVELAIIGNSSPRELKRAIKVKITGLTRSQKFYSYGEAHLLGNKIYDLRNAIVEDLAGQDIQGAIECAEQLLTIHPHVYECVDDSAGVVWPVFQQLVDDLAQLYDQGPDLNRCALAEKVFEWHTTQDYNAYDDVVRSCGKVLANDGLVRLEELYREEVSSSRQIKDWKSDLRRMRAVDSLLEISDARGDVNQYIAVTHEFSVLNVDSRIEIAKRLLDSDLPHDALKYLEEEEGANELIRLGQKARALQMLGRNLDAQQCRIEALNYYPEVSRFNEILQHAEDPEELRTQLLDNLSKHIELHMMLGFLIEIEAFDRAATLVFSAPNTWDGNSYYTLAPAAKALEQCYPLAATILYRALIDDVLARAQSRYYHHAVRYFKAATKRSKQISYWDGLPDHNRYVSGLREQHARKRAFWGKLEDAGVNV